MQKNWFYRNKSYNQDFSKKFNVHNAIIKIMSDRGIESESDVAKYLNASMEDVSSGEELTDMKNGVSIMHKCIIENKRIRVMADYDVDGATSGYILHQGLKGLGANCDIFIPHRIEDGYGLHESAIQKAKEDGVEVIITCDNGIAAANEIKMAKDFGMTVIVTDHHEVPFESLEDGSKKYIIPEADAVIDPKRPEDTEVFKEICGAVVAWKFIGCLYKSFKKEEDFNNSDFLEFASLGTVCDVMELLHENRSIVKEGLKHMKKTSNIGMQALLEVLDLKDKDLSSYDYGFKIGPCINAEGRLDNALNAFNLFVETDYEEALKKAKTMRELNATRQELTKKGMEEAFKIVDETMTEDKVLVVYLPDCHESIAGIIAGKVRERYNKPAFVLTKSKDFIKGSGRSIEKFSMYNELVKCKDLLLGFGGHPLAAGLSLKPENLDDFRKLINNNCTLTEKDFIPKVFIDVVMPVEFLTKDFIEQLNVLEPFGKGNEKPVFAQRNVKGLRAEIIGKNKNVLKVTLDNRNCKNAVCFHDIEEKESLLKTKLYDFNMLYYPSINEWNGVKTIQAIISDIH